MRKLLFSLVFLIAILLALELGVTLLSQHGVEKAMCRQYHLPDSLEVSINSFPFIVSLARNHLGELRLEWHGELCCIYAEEEETYTPYSARVELYDVELKMASLLIGKLEINSISRMKARIVFSEGALENVLCGENGVLLIEDGVIYKLIDGEKIKYEVKVLGESAVCFEQQTSSMVDIDSAEGVISDGVSGFQKIELRGLPLDARLKKASSEGNEVILHVFIPMWEGYI